ncbi:MFS transporter [Amantichitinum ursilacus]|uniref:Inner membrane transport protein YdhP n=1 Tax=Amantichitinum ursilacus TaxID=857265 RepID=A0A0N0XL78_9NEIS|nr:MFS transporter [Amantichitinum ursilacus]KPC55407.1 Inner membrane transport protein YdhP [Amantichitinum ursilacus]
MDKSSNALVWKLTFGVFGILTTELGMVGILPLVARVFQVSVAQAGWTVSLFALGVAVAGLFMPAVFAGVNRKYAMLLVQAIFVLGNLTAMYTNDFNVLLASRLIPALFHPIYCSAAFVLAAQAGGAKEAPKAVARVMMGVSAGMVFGVPVTSYIASLSSFKTAMLFFAAVNGIALLLTLLTVPSLPVAQRASYGAQSSVLKRGVTWVSLATVALIAASMASVYSYVADYLQNITHVSPSMLSAMLLLFGIASIYGNPVAGKVLSKYTTRPVLLFPFALGAIYLALLALGHYALPMCALICLWGVIYGAGNNFQQYWISSALPTAPDLANGLFLSFGNIGIVLGTSIGGALIADRGVQSILAGGLALLVLTFVSVVMRLRWFNQPA